MEQDKQRSELLRKQLVQMGEDFEFMKKSKDEWKKQLDARFQDIERYDLPNPEKSKAASSTLPTKLNAPMIPFWLSNINSSSKSRKPEKTYRITSTHFQSRRLKSSNRRTRKSLTSIRT